MPYNHTYFNAQERMLHCIQHFHTQNIAALATLCRVSTLSPSPTSSLDIISMLPSGTRHNLCRSSPACNLTLNYCQTRQIHVLVWGQDYRYTWTRCDSVLDHELLGSNKKPLYSKLIGGLLSFLNVSSPD